MTETTAETTAAPVPAGWTWKLSGDGAHWPLYVSAPDADGRQDAVRVALDRKDGGAILSFLDDVGALEDRGAVGEELDEVTGLRLSAAGSLHSLDAAACAGLALWLLSALTIDEGFLGDEGLGCWVPKISQAALKLNEAHTQRLHAELDKITGALSTRDA